MQKTGFLGLSLAAVLVTAAPPWAQGSCRLSVGGSKCIQVPNAGQHGLKPGDPLPEDARLVLNPRYYGLPSVDGAWRYYTVGRDVYRVDNQSLEIIERVWADGAILR